MTDSEELRELAEAGVKRALAAGVGEAEVYLTRTRSLLVAADVAGVAPSLGIDEGIGVRVIRDGRMGFSGVPSLRGLDQAIRRAADAAGRPSAVAAASFTTHAASASLRSHVAIGREQMDAASGFAQRVVDDATSRPKVAYVEARYKRWGTTFAVANSAGLCVHDALGSERLEIELRVDGATSSRSASDVWLERGTLGTLDVADAVSGLTARATDALDATPLGGNAVREVIFQPGPASQVLGIASPAFSGISAASRQSALADRLGQQVYAPNVTLMDEPHAGAASGARAYDDEGTPTRSHTLVKDGRLEGFLYDAQTARLNGREPTGHGLRKGVTGGIAPRPIGMTMSPGDSTLEELIEQADRAVLVTEPLLGSFTSNQVTGDFSVVVPFAFLIEGGRVRRALPPTSIGGNAHDVLAKIRVLGRERRAYKPGTLPPILTGGVSCAT